MNEVHDASIDLPDDAPWWEDPAELDRTLEGELDARTLAAREADLARRAASLAPRRAFLASLATAGAAWRASRRAHTPAGLESRVRFALRRDRRRRGAGRWIPAAAVLLVAVGAWLLRGGGERADAMPPAVLQAAAVARSAVEEPGGCDAPSGTGPMQFPPVKDGTLRVRNCRADAAGTVATLYRPEDLPSVGYVAVAAEGAGRGPDLGMTDLGDVVVYDLVYGRTRHYLAVSKEFLDAQARRHPGRESCRACHNRSREGQANPHNIVQRSWRLGG